MQTNDFQMGPDGLYIPRQKVFMSGRYSGQLIRAGKVIEEFDDHNLIVNEGLNSVLDVYLGAATQLTAWYLGVFEGNYTPVSTDTAANIVANSTESTAITAGTRAVWTPVAASGQSVTNAAARATFTFNATKTIYGAFLISNSALSSTTGKLFSAARFATPKAVVNLDQLLLTYTFSASSV